MTDDDRVPPAQRRERPGILSVRDLVVRYSAHSIAVDGVDIDVRQGESVGLVGESGCGKSSTARAIMRLVPATGSIRLDGRELTTLRPGALRRTRRHLQMIFQDPISSLNPRRRVRDIVAEGLSDWRGRVAHPVREKVDSTLAAVGLDPATLGNRYPRQLSGGQCQRVSIARALMLEPSLLICDEPVAALDVSVQAQILNLLRGIIARSDLSLLFISHDLGVIRYICDRVVVMYLGRVVETADVATLFERPSHPYTRLLLDSIPDPVRDRQRMANLVPQAVKEATVRPDGPDGCQFRGRCPFARERCAVQTPVLREVEPGQLAACHFAEEVRRPSVDVRDGAPSHRQP